MGRQGLMTAPWPQAFGRSRPELQQLQELGNSADSLQQGDHIDRPVKPVPTHTHSSEALARQGNTSKPQACKQSHQNGDLWEGPPLRLQVLPGAHPLEARSIVQRFEEGSSPAAQACGQERASPGEADEGCCKLPRPGTELHLSGRLCGHKSRSGWLQPRSASKTPRGTASRSNTIWPRHCLGRTHRDTKPWTAEKTPSRLLPG